MAQSGTQETSALSLMAMTQPLRAAAISTPRKIATRFNGRDQTWTEVQSNVARLASALKGLGLEEGDRTAILSLNSDRFTEYLFATWWAGGCVVPMNVRWSPAENAYSLRDSGADILFVDATFAPMLPAIRAEVPDLNHVIYLGDDTAPDGMVAWTDLINANDPIPDCERGGEDLAGLYYTGGTTGFPKGVMLSHSALWYNAMAAASMCSLEAEHIYLHAAPMFHLADGALSAGVTLAGASHVYIAAFDPVATQNAMAEYGVTHAVLVPTMLAMVLQHPEFDPDKFASLRTIIYGASPMPEGVLRQAMELLPEVSFVQAYGQTELGPLATSLPASCHELDGPNSARLKSAGRAVLGAEIRLVNDQGSDVEPGEVGEIVVRSPGAMQGYWNMPEQTAATLVDGWVHTGDGGYRDDDGFIFIVDRMKDMIVTGGENVFSAEVESALSTHPAVAEVAVIGIPAEQWGEAVHAIVVLKADETVTEEALIEHCRSAIANYKLPRSITFREEPLPLSGAGKVLKRDLRAPYWKDTGRQVN